eukprot:6203334-Pleurochrysis_carterae.AAC.1
MHVSAMTCVSADEKTLDSFGPGRRKGTCRTRSGAPKHHPTPYACVHDREARRLRRAVTAA